MKDQNQKTDAEKGKLTFYDRAGKQQDIYFEQGNTGLEFYRLGGGGNKISLMTYEVDLLDELQSIMYPLENLVHVLKETGDEPEPIYFILDKMLSDVYDRIGEVCKAVKKAVGEISIHAHTSGGDCAGLRRNEILMAIVEAPTADDGSVKRELIDLAKAKKSMDATTRKALKTLAERNKEIEREKKQATKRKAA